MLLISFKEYIVKKGAIKPNLSVLSGTGSCILLFLDIQRSSPVKKHILMLERTRDGSGCSLLNRFLLTPAHYEKWLRHHNPSGTTRPHQLPIVSRGAFIPYPSSFRLPAIAASRLAAPACCSRSLAVSRLIFFLNGSPSLSCTSAPT